MAEPKEVVPSHAEKEDLDQHNASGTDGREEEGSNSVSEEEESIAEIRRRESRSTLDHVSTHVSLGPDNPVEHYSSFVEVPDEVYDRFPNHRKTIIVVLLSFCSFLAPISSTSVLAATPEVAADFNTNGTIINVSNAIYMLMMGISPIVWGPFSEVYGRKMVSSSRQWFPSLPFIGSTTNTMPRSARSALFCSALPVSARHWRLT